MKTPKVPSTTIRDSALKQMDHLGKPLREIKSRSRAMLYEMPDGKSVRIRTTNDPILVVVADSTSEEASLNIEGTDYLLISMPETPRTPGPIKSYLVPTDIAVQAVKDSHKKWLETNPNTRGENRTWNIWFEDTGKPSGGFADKWAEYLLPVPMDTASVSADDTGTDVERRYAPGKENASGHAHTPGPAKVADVIEDARRKIADLTGLPLASIQIDIKLGV